MKVLPLILFVLVFTSVSTSANPGSWMPTAKKISSIIVEGDENGRALIIIEGGVPSEFIPSECRTGSDSTYNTVFLNTHKGRGIYSMALTAYSAGKPVKLALSCTGSRPLITHIWLM
ncbi:hypothetical protein CTT30_06765 [Vibrio coralliilyticus]|nr:hypothetical protein CTT30_06765 [Vibrio coralliilyticus]